MSSSHRRRLAMDQASLRADPPPDFFFPPSESSADELTSLNINLVGPTQTPFENGLFAIHLQMTTSYPQEPPKARFKTKIFHPNVDERTGDVCVDTLKRDWKLTLTLKDVLVTIRCLLVYPNPTSSLNEAAGKLLLEDYDRFSRHAKLMTEVHALIPHEMMELVDKARNRGEEDGGKGKRTKEGKLAGKVMEAAKSVTGNTKKTSRTVTSSAPALEKTEKCSPNETDSEAGDSGKENSEIHGSKRSGSPLGKHQVAEPLVPLSGDSHAVDDGGRKSPKLKEGQNANARKPTQKSTTEAKPSKIATTKSGTGKVVAKPVKKVGLKRF
ncbi:hypothetical protein RUND412_005049 [Rhizina undulata]